MAYSTTYTDERGSSVPGEIIESWSYRLDNENLYLPDGKIITVAGALTGSSKIGVTTWRRWPVSRARSFVSGSRCTPPAITSPTGTTLPPRAVPP